MKVWCNMRILQLIDEDVTNYKKTAMFIGTIVCDGKCWKEQNLPRETCQNSCMYNNPNVKDINDDILCKRYIENPLTEAIVFGGLEPILQIDELKKFIHILRYKYKCNDDIVIYTGYTEEECIENNYFNKLSEYDNIIYKVGRYRPDLPSHYDSVLGVKLISSNQYGLKQVTLKKENVS